MATDLSALRAVIGDLMEVVLDAVTQQADAIHLHWTDYRESLFIAVTFDISGESTKQAGLTAVDTDLLIKCLAVCNRQAHLPIIASTGRSSAPERHWVIKLRVDPLISSAELSQVAIFLQKTLSDRPVA